MSALPPAAQRTVRVAGARVRVWEAGEGEPLLFLHGWGLSPLPYAEGLRRLAATGVRVVAPSLPGFAGSDPFPLTQLTLAAHADRVAGLLDVLGVTEPVHLAGHSFGGGVALQLAGDRPERVRSLTLLNTVGGCAPDPWAQATAWLRSAPGTLLELTPEAVVRSGRAVLRAYLPNALQRPLTLALTVRLALTACLADTAATLAATGLPVLTVFSEQDEVVAPGALARLGAPVRVRWVPGRHGWPLVAPGDLSAVLADAVRAVPAAAPAPAPAPAPLAALIPAQRQPVRAAVRPSVRPG